MVSTFTPNVGFELPARGDYVGTWDTPANGNEILSDLILGGRTTISGAAGSLVLSAAQFQCKTITFNSTLLASITVTFPTSFTKSYEIYHTCTGSSAYTITLQTTAGGNVIAVPPGDICEVWTDGINMRFKNFGRIGAYWDYAGSSVPNWVSACSIAPYLACTGVEFSSALYPVLATILGSTTTPDQRGRVRVAVDGGAGRLSSAVAGFNPDTVGGGGGVESITLATSQIPAHVHGVTDAGHIHPSPGVFNGTGGAFDLFYESGGFQVANYTGSATTGITINSAGGGALHGNIQPTMVAGIVMIRAA